MQILFMIAAGIAVAATILAVSSRVTLHALLYLALSLLAVAVAFYTMGAPFVAALEVIIYAGAIVVLFVFAVMLLSPRIKESVRDRRRGGWAGPAALAVILFAEITYIVVTGPNATLHGRVVGPKEVGLSLFGAFAVASELASILLLVALVGARHLGGRRDDPGAPVEEER